MLDDPRGLAHRMAVYLQMVGVRFPGKVLRQAVVYAPVDRSKRSQVPPEIRYESRDRDDRGLVFSAPVIDLRTVGVEHFRASGELDDLLLGLLALGDTIPGYLDEVADRIRRLPGARRLDGIEKLVAVMALGDTRASGALEKDFEMWMEEVKDRQIVKDIIEIAGKDRLREEREQGEAAGVALGVAEGRKRAYAELILDSVAEKGLSDDPGLIEFLVESADEATLKSMARTAPDMEDLDGFLQEHGIALPGHRP